MASNPKPSLYLQNKDEVHQVFASFDANRDGKISTEELRCVLDALRSSTSADEVSKMMEEIDTDKDGHINLEEFAAFCSGDSDPYQSDVKELKKAFDMYDQDQDDKILAAEIHKILTRLGESCSEQDCTGMIKSVDSDGDGYVCFEEFRKMMTNNKGEK